MGDKIRNTRLYHLYSGRPLLVLSTVSFFITVTCALFGYQFGFELWNPITILMSCILTVTLLRELGPYCFSASFIAAGMFCLFAGEFLHFYCHYVIKSEPYNQIIRVIFLVPTLCLALNELIYYYDKLKGRRRDFSAVLVNSFCFSAIGFVVVYKVFLELSGGNIRGTVGYINLFFVFLAFNVVVLCLQSLWLVGWNNIWKGTNILTFSILFYEITDIWYVFTQTMGRVPDNNIIDILYTLFIMLMPVGIIIQLEKRYVFTFRNRDYTHGATRQRLIVTFVGVCISIILMIEGFFSNMEMLYIIITLMAYTIMGYLMNTGELEKVRISQIAAEESSKAKSEFLSNMSHEIRTPINSILGMDEMILRETSDPTLRNYAMNIQRSGRMLLALVSDVLDFSRIEAGKTKIVCDEYNPALMMSDIFGMLNSAAAEKGLYFTMDLDKELPEVLYGDHGRISQVIINLLTNAIKYTKRGGIVTTVKSEKKDSECINMHVSVKDTGIGIKKEDLEKLFKAFERIEEARNRNIEGTGLGMNIVWKLLQLMDSRPVVESEYGKGSTFSFVITQKVISWEPIGEYEIKAEETEQEYEPYHALFTAPDAKILLVDDTDMNLLVVCNLLKRTLVQVDTAVDGRQALFMSERKEYDLLLIDHRMPVMDGMEMIKILRSSENNPNAKKPCIVFTANAIAGAREEYLAAGFDDCIVKPVAGKQLEKSIKKYIPKEKIQDPTLSALGERGYLNVREGLAYASDRDMYLAALKLFVGTIDKKSEEIRGFYEAGDWNNYQIKVHALKSSAKVIGAGKLSNQAKALELAISNADLDYVHEHTEEVLAFYGSYKNKLKNVLEP